MRCERIQELILTDSMDKALDERTAREVEGHIRSCAACREFRRVAQEASVEPFKAAPRAEAPSYIWERVKGAIAAGEPERRGVLEEIFRSLGRIPKPAVVFAAAVVMIIAVFIARPIVQTRGANAYLAEQADFMWKLGMAETNGNGFFDTEIKTSADTIL